MAGDPDEMKEVLRAQLRSKATRNPDNMELYELSQLSGVTMDPHVFEILLDLLRQNVPPEAIVEMLRSMCSQKYGEVQQENLNPSQTSGMSMPAVPASASTLPSQSRSGNSGSLRDLRDASISSSGILNNASSLADLSTGGRSSSHRNNQSRKGSGDHFERGVFSSEPGGRSNSCVLPSRPDAFVTTRPRNARASASDVTSVSSRSGKRTTEENRRSYHR